MAVSTTTNKVIFACNGSQTEFPFTFPTPSADEIQVILYTIADGTETTLTETTNYTIAASGGDYDNGGTVTTLLAYSSDYKLIIKRILDNKQEIDFVENDPLPAETLENGLDYGAMRDQQLQEQIDRAVLQDSASTITVTMPAPEDGLALVWDGVDGTLANSNLTGATGATGAAGADGADGTIAVSGTFTNADLSTGVLTVTHNLSLSAPYSVNIVMFDNTGAQVIPDSITGSANSVAVDLSSYGTLTGTWGYIHGTESTVEVASQAEAEAGANNTKVMTPLRTFQSIMSAVYPVGSIYTNAAVATNPGTLLGFGTWTAFGAGKVMVGLDSGDADFDTVEETGGSKTHTLTEAELPSHTHSITLSSSISDNTGANSNYVREINTTDSSVTATSGATGSGNAHNNVQPYIVVYMWKRTA